MRTFFATHWKSIVALIILVLLAVFTMSPGAADAGLAARLRRHASAIAADEHNIPERDLPRPPTCKA